MRRQTPLGTLTLKDDARFPCRDAAGLMSAGCAAMGACGTVEPIHPSRSKQVLQEEGTTTVESCASGCSCCTRAPKHQLASSYAVNYHAHGQPSHLLQLALGSTSRIAEEGTFRFVGYEAALHVICAHRNLKHFVVGGLEDGESL